MNPSIYRYCSSFERQSVINISELMIAHFLTHHAVIPPKNNGVYLVGYYGSPTFCDAESNCHGEPVFAEFYNCFGTFYGFWISTP